MEDKQDFSDAMPPSMKPAYAKSSPQFIRQENIKPRRSKGRIAVWIIIVIIVIVALIQYFNAAKYSAMVNVINEDRIGVNPTGNALDFGDLPRDKSAIRTVSLVSQGNTPSYVIVWKFGSISDLVNVDKNYFTLPAHSSDKLQFTAQIPNSADYKIYSGKVIIFQIPKIW
jgi:hypothetical protein